MRVFLVDGTFELFRQFYGAQRHRSASSMETAGVVGVLSSVLQLLEEGATHLGVATDHVIESFRNDLWAGYKTGDGIESALWAQFGPIEEGLVDVAHSIEVGLRGSIYDSGDWTGLRTELGLEYLTTEDVFALGPEVVASQVRERVGDRPAFISFDIDVVDPAFAPGTGTPEAGGPSAHDMLVVLRGLTGIEFVGFDVVEVIPAYDPAGQTATLAANLAYEMLSLVALRRAGA